MAKSNAKTPVKVLPATAKVEAVEVSSSQYWWLFLVHGILSVLVGWLLLVNPIVSVVSFVLFLGLYWLAMGIVDIIYAIINATQGASQWGWKLVGGIVSVLAGLFVLNQPLFASVFTPIVFMYVVAFTFLINGIVTMAVGGKAKVEGQFSWTWGNFFLGLFNFVIGIMLLSAPTLVSVASLVFATGLIALVGGVISIIFSFRVRSEGKN